MAQKRQKTLSDLIDMSDPQVVLEEVRTIMGMIFREPSFQMIEQAFTDTVRLYAGEYPGYRRCTTLYHDLKHATYSMLAMARLVHGAILAGHPLKEYQVTLGLMCAIMHDTGYIQTEKDNQGTGAMYTGCDTARSIEFVKTYLADHELMGKEFAPYADILICASLEAKVAEISFPSPAVELLCKLLGTADLMGQMADRIYLEKLLFLYEEFREANVADYTDELDLLWKTKDFYEMVKMRLREDFSGVCDYVQHHFRERWSIDRNLYSEAIEANIKYLTYILDKHERDYRNYLRRENVVWRLRGKGR